MPRSDRTGTPLEINKEIEKTAKILRKQTKLRKKLDYQKSHTTSTLSPTPPSTSTSTPISDFSTNPLKMGDEEKTLRQWGARKDTQQPLCINYPNVENFELKSGLIHLLPTFRGLENEDPHKFLKEFHVVCSGMKPHNVTEDQIKLRAFPFALYDAAKEWLYYLPPGTVTTWNDIAQAFLDKYFPEPKASSIRREILTLHQGRRESLHTYWERFKKLCSRCPQHGLSEHQLLQYFCEGLSHLDRRIINASSGGALLDKTPSQIRALIATLAKDSKHSIGEDEWYPDPPRGEKQVSTPLIETQLNELTKAVILLTKERGIEPKARACGICLQHGHPTDMCPSLQDENEHVNAMGDHMGQNSRNFDNNQSWKNAQPRSQYQPRYQQPQHAAPRNPSGMSLEEIVSNLAKNTISFQQETRASIQNLETQMTQLATTVSKLESRLDTKLPAQTEANPRHNVSAISLRSGKVCKDPIVPEDAEKEGTKQAESPSHIPSPPFPSRFLESKKEREDREIMATFRKVEVNIPLLEAIKQVPRYAKFLKELCTSKKKLKGDETIKVNENVSAIIQKRLPPKYKDPGVFTVPCKLGDTYIPRVMLDLGASINVLPLSIFKNLKKGTLKRTGVVIQLADKSTVRPKGVLEDILVQVNNLVFPADFYVVDMGDDDSPNSNSTLLGRPFLKTSRTKIDVFNGTLSMEFDGEVVTFNIDQSTRYPSDVPPEDLRENDSLLPNEHTKSNNNLVAMVSMNETTTGLTEESKPVDRHDHQDNDLDLQNIDPPPGPKQTRSKHRLKRFTECFTTNQGVDIEECPG
ncbi:hypothetical protein L2E82_32777 [Cichorium intybus]|uniref:Uncharacterized protein n=1 Tax=Cichorium intybus TaxID=13427 RepID=A0ACB9BHC9_CICIN|nr:hypothetical protein L2E82_32777 [Cichorium intybus]